MSAFEAMSRDRDMKFKPMVLQEDDAVPRGACRAVKYEQSVGIHTAFEDVVAKGSEVDLSG